jgi:methionyl-tRNA formyltransferase
VTIITNGNYFSRIALQNLLRSQSDDLIVQVFVTTGLRKSSGNRANEAFRLLRLWGARYSLYKIATYVVPALGERIQRRPLFVRAECERLGLQYHVVRNVNSAPATKIIGAFVPDLIVSYSCPYKIGNELLSIPRIGSLNCHSSLLPAYAGVCTYVHVLAEGQTTTGVTVHEMVSRFDAGRILAQEKIPIPDGTSVFELFATQCRVAGQLLPRVVKECLASGSVGGTAQELSERSYRGEPTKDDVSRLRARGHRLLRMKDMPELMGAGSNRGELNTTNA